MIGSTLTKITAVASLGFLLVGCENMPGDRGTQGAVVGGVGGAAVGAAVGGEKHRVLGAILGGAVGAAGGYVVGTRTDKSSDDRAAVEAAAQKSQTNPATAQEAMNATTADLNRDGFVTLDEVVAMESAGITDDQMLERLRATGQVFELTTEHKRYLTDHGVSQHVVDQMDSINKSARDAVLNQNRGVISRPQ